MTSIYPQLVSTVNLLMASTCQGSHTWALIERDSLYSSLPMYILLQLKKSLCGILWYIDIYIYILPFLLSLKWKFGDTSGAWKNNNAVPPWVQKHCVHIPRAPTTNKSHTVKQDAVGVFVFCVALIHGGRHCPSQLKAAVDEELQPITTLRRRVNIIDLCLLCIDL